MIDNNDPQDVIANLSKSHNKKLFFCEHEALDRCLKEQASQDIKKSISGTYVFSKQGSYDVIGYYSLSPIAIIPGELPEGIIKILPRYLQLPGILLGRLAVDKNYKGYGLGKYLLVDALKRSLDISHQIGGVAVIVDAKDQNAANFYKHFEFIEFHNDKRKLFLPMETIKQLDFA